MQFIKAKSVSLRAHQQLNEKWLQELLQDDPSLLGLGDLVVKDVERRQPRAGRLDLLLADPDSGTRYEVEIQLGPTDEAHIIRTLEYWDIEKSRYPQYEHVAVIVAEDVTSRFLNVISLFNKSVPLVAVQMRALEVNGALTLCATTVLDVTRAGTEEEDEPGQPADRNFWTSRASPSSVALVDGVLELVNDVAPGFSLKYNKNYIGLARHGVVDNLVACWPRREFAFVEFRLAVTEEVSALVEESGMELASPGRRFSRDGRVRLRLAGDDLVTHRDMLRELIRRAYGSPASTEQ